jgi:hypothetical protein
LIGTIKTEKSEVIDELKEEIRKLQEAVKEKDTQIRE